MKKQIFFAAFFLLTAFILHAQPKSVRLYGFKQQTTGGMQKRGDIDETGKLTKTIPANVFQHTIYLSSKSKMKIYPVQMWINGEAFSIRKEAVTKLPVVPMNEEAPASKMKPLIPDATEDLWKLKPLPFTGDKSNSRAKAMAEKNAVVVLYRRAGKMHYAVLKKFTDISPTSLQ